MILKPPSPLCPGHPDRASGAAGRAAAPGLLYSERAEPIGGTPLAGSIRERPDEEHHTLTEDDLPPTRWREDASYFFLRYADVIVPERQEQLALAVSLIPAAPDEAFTVVDLGCGAGKHGARILER
jgi:hypothetical protein